MLNFRKNDKEKYKIVYVRLMAFMFLITIFSFVGLSYISKDKEFSENENRVLQQKPSFTMDRLFEGRYTKKYEKYKVDQIVGRDEFIRMKTKIDSLLGKNKEKDVYKSDDGYLIEDFNKPNEGYLEDNITAINNFYNNHKNIKTYMLIAPNAVNILNDKLPAFAPVYNQQEYIDGLEKAINSKIDFIDISNELRKHKDEYIYYKTDHHWTTLGAYYGFLDFANKAGLQVKENSYDKFRVANDFYGTLYSKSGYNVDPDQVDIYVPKDKNDEVIVEYKEEQKKTTTIFDSKSLDKKDKYEVFLGGNHPLVDIKTTSESDKTILIMKDSYANSFVQFLTPYYKEIIMVDPRYYYEDIEKLIKEKDVTDMLYLYNANTFFNDSSLAPVLNND